MPSNQSKQFCPFGAGPRCARPLFEALGPLVMLSRTNRLTISLLSLFLVSCDQEALFESFIPKEEAAYAKAHLALYQQGDIEKIIYQLNPVVVDEATPDTVQGVIELFPDDDPIEILTVGSHTVEGSSSWSANLTFQYKFSESWLLAAVSLQRVNGELLINGVNIQLIETSLQELNAFRIDGQGFLGFFVILLASVISVFCIVTFIMCLRTPIPKRKWAWAIFTLLGFGTTSFNWTTGEVGYSVFSFQLLGAGFVKAGLYGPLVISFALPIGGIVFLSRRQSWLEEAKRADP